jgi:ketosteroid isomerase-like protein
MSHENAEIVRRFVAALNAGDLDAAMALCDESVVYINPDDAAEPGTRTGQAEFRLAVEGLLATFEGFNTAIEDMKVIGDEVVVVGRSTGTGRLSGIPFNQARSHLFEVRDGRIASFRWFQGVHEAHELAGPRAELARQFRASMEAYSRGDFDAALVTFHPEVEWIPDSRVMPDGTVYHGHEGVRCFWETWAEVIDDMELEIESCEAIDDSRVLAVTRARGRGTGSGAGVTSGRFAQLAEYRDRKAVRVWLFGDVRRARAAAGLDG